MSQELTPDLAVFARWIVPVVPSGVVLENHAILVSNGKISHLLPAEQARHELSPEALAWRYRIRAPRLDPRSRECTRPCGDEPVTRGG
jgi:hypothetical protein